IGLARACGARMRTTTRVAGSDSTIARPRAWRVRLEKGIPMPSDDGKVGFSSGADGTDVSGKRPYTIVFVSDLGAGERLDALASVDKDNFADFVRRAGVTAPVAVKSP